MRSQFRNIFVGIALSVLVPMGVVRAQASSTICTDGSPSASSGRGACSGHGGVDAKATAAAKSAAAKAKKAEKAAAKAAAKAAKQTSRTRADARADAASTAPSSKKPSKGAQVTCTDGTMGTAGRGACSGHGGIAAVTVPTPTPRTNPIPNTTAPRPTTTTRSTPAPRAPSNPSNPSSQADNNDPRDAMAQCKDGTYSHAANHQGACSRHGGVLKFLKPTQ